MQLQFRQYMSLMGVHHPAKFHRDRPIRFRKRFFSLKNHMFAYYSILAESNELKLGKAAYFTVHLPQFDAQTNPSGGQINILIRLCPLPRVHHIVGVEFSPIK